MKTNILAHYKSNTKKNPVFGPTLFNATSIILQVLLTIFVAKQTRVCGITGSASARRWGDDGFKSQPKSRHS